MNLKTVIIFSLLVLSMSSAAQVNDSINNTDKYGKKQGHWIKKYPSGHILYDGYFKDDQPTGVFKRYFENDSLHSILVFSSDGKEAQASIFHPNGFLASQGKFVKQLKEGKWLFFSSRIENYLISEEDYIKNIKNGPSIKYYSDKTICEKLNYVNDVKQGEWIQYFSSGTPCLKANYINGKLEGKYEVFYDNGKPEYSGQYKNDTRDGVWDKYNADGTLKKKIEYIAGYSKNSDLDQSESDYLDAIEKNKGKIKDPEKTGTLWE
jgi:antitoxin component YwqK of YwqJK toxin-antitoxin module